MRALQILSETYKGQKTGAAPLEKTKEYAALHPKSAPVQDFLGVMLMANGDRTQARSAFNAAKQADPRFMKADLSLAQLDVLDGKLDDAQKRLQGVISGQDDNLTAHLWLGNVEEMKGDHTAAMDQYRRVMLADPGNAQAANNLAYLLDQYRSGSEEALQYAEKAVELRPERSAYCDTLGWIFYRKGLYEPAIKYLQKASSDNSDVVWKYHLAMAYAKTGDVGRAREELQQALRLNPKVPEAQAAQRVVGTYR